MPAYARFKELPEVCKGCRFNESDSQDEYSINYHFCTRGLILPTKSQACKLKENQNQKAWWQLRKGGE